MNEQNRISLSTAYFKKLGFHLGDKVIYRGNKGKIIEFNGWNTTDLYNNWTGVTCFAVINYENPLVYISKTFYSENVFGIMIKDLKAN